MIDLLKSVLWFVSYLVNNIPTHKNAQTTAYRPAMLIKTTNVKSEDSNRIITNSLVVENLRVSSVGVFTPQLPHIKERLPVNEIHQTI